MLKYLLVELLGYDKWEINLKRNRMVRTSQAN